MNMNTKSNWTDNAGWIAKRVVLVALKVALWATALVLIIGGLTQLIWNAIIPDLFHLPEISFGQAIGLAVLGRLLAGGWLRFGGLGWGGWRGHRGHWRKHWHQRWQNLTPEQREQYRQMYYQRCRPQPGNEQSNADAKPAGASPTAL
jgi:hypothetical protein